jgi:hypothetical protein
VARDDLTKPCWDCRRFCWRDSLAKHFKCILEMAGLPPIRLYDLRHTAATLSLAAGVSPKAVSEQLGHASAAFTFDTYAHVLPTCRTRQLRNMKHCFSRSVRLQLEHLLIGARLFVSDNPTPKGRMPIFSSSIQLVFSCVRDSGLGTVALRPPTCGQRGNRCHDRVTLIGN